MIFKKKQKRGESMSPVEAQVGNLEKTVPYAYVTENGLMLVTSATIKITGFGTNYGEPWVDVYCSGRTMRLTKGETLTVQPFVELTIPIFKPTLKSIG